MTATIIGATSLDQLRTNIASIDVTLPNEALIAIEAVYHDLPAPCP